MIRSIRYLIFFVLMAVAFYGCGKSEDSNTALVARAADATGSAGTAKMDVEFQMGPALITGGGIINVGKYRASLRVLVPFTTGEASMRLIDEDLYFKISAELAKFPKPWIKISFVKQIKSVSGSTVTIAASVPGGFVAWFDQLRGATSATKVGVEKVRGVQATHFRTVVDLRKAVDKTPPGGRNAMRRYSEQMIKAQSGKATISVDVWLDDQGRVVRELFDAAPNGPVGKLKFDLFRFGGNETVERPPSDQVVDSAKLTPAGRP